MGGAVSTGQDNDELIDNLLQADYIRSPTVERVFRAVDRADYFLPDARGNAYKDLAWKCGHLHLSAPCIYSEVIEGLRLYSGLSFLNLGSGTGYLSTMVGLMLGNNGINHGVEIHEDVVQYACKKLEDFKKLSGAIDEFDFCEPKFVHGNCLCLTTERQYDRVYCGAACPEPYESYMKNLLKVGGILVMPLNEHLMQIKRTTEISWDTCSLLPVSFATLIQPPEGKQVVVEMMDVIPLTLQSLSRAVVRSILRKNVELENPDLKRRTPPVKQSKRKERALRRFVVPVFDDSADDMLSSDGEERSAHNRRNASNIFNIVMDHLGYRVRGRRGSARRNEERNNAGNEANLSNTEEEMEVETDNNSTNNSNDTEPVEVQAVIEPEPGVSNSNNDSMTEVAPASEGEKKPEEKVVVEAGNAVPVCIGVLNEIDRVQERTEEQVENDLDLVFFNVLQDLERRRRHVANQVNEEELQEDLSNLEVLSKETEKCNTSDNGNTSSSCNASGDPNTSNSCNALGSNNCIPSYTSDKFNTTDNCTSDNKCDNTAKDSILEAGTSTAKPTKKTGREKFDSGFGEEIVEKNATNSDSSDQENMEFDSSSSGNEDNDGKRNKRGSKQNGEVRSGAKWRRICLSSHRYDSYSSSSDSETVQEEEVNVAIAPRESRPVASPYTAHMRTKIQQLPLPPILKNYLNFYREF